MRRATGRGLSAIFGAVLLIAGSVAFPSVPSSAAPPVAGDEKPRKCVSACDVYVGDANKWDKPAEVDCNQVYGKIDEYRQIVDAGLKPGDAKYEILMSKASQKFTAAVKKTAKSGGYDLIAKLGSVKGAGKVPNVTADAIANL